MYLPGNTTASPISEDQLFCVESITFFKFVFGSFLFSQILAIMYRPGNTTASPISEDQLFCVESITFLKLLFGSFLFSQILAMDF